MTPRQRLIEQITRLGSILVDVEDKIESYRTNDALLQLSSAIRMVEEILGKRPTCNCLAYDFPHRRGSTCPENLHGPQA